MLIHVGGKGFELSPELREDVEQRIERALERFRPRIGRVNVFLADENGPKNGIDKSARVIIDIERLPLIIIEEKGEAWSPMLDCLVERVTHTISRQLQRIRSRTDRVSMAGESNRVSDLDGDAID